VSEVNTHVITCCTRVDAEVVLFDAADVERRHGMSRLSISVLCDAVFTAVTE